MFKSEPWDVNGPPLKPIIRPDLPPHACLPFSKARSEYRKTHRPDWWSAHNSVDASARLKMMEVVRFRHLEENNYWLNFKDKDGKSFGFDYRYMRNWGEKGGTPIPREEWQKKVNEASPQFQELARHFKISPEHPGIYASPTLNQNENLSPNGRSFAPANWANTFYDPFKWGNWRLPGVGPRFFDSPLNQDPHMKALAAAKYTALFCIPGTLSYIQSTNPNWYYTRELKEFIKAYVKFSYRPLLISAWWGFSLSTAAMLRNVDDLYNYVYASGALTLAIYSCYSQSWQNAFFFGAVSYITSVIVHYQRCKAEGLAPISIHRYTRRDPVFTDWLLNPKPQGKLYKQPYLGTDSAGEEAMIVLRTEPENIEWWKENENKQPKKH